MSNTDKPSEQVVQIDETNLDRECINLPSQFLRWMHKAADARRDLDELKAEQSAIEADLSRQIRDTPAKFGLEKATENAVKSAIEGHSKVVEIVRRIVDLKHRLALCDGVVTALEAKKTSLKLLIDLRITGWFGEVKTSAEGHRAVKEMSRDRVYNRRRED